MGTGYYRTTLSVQQPEKDRAPVELNLMGSQGDIGAHDGILPPIQPGMKKVESTSEIMNLTLHQVMYVCQPLLKPGHLHVSTSHFAM